MLRDIQSFLQRYKDPLVHDSYRMLVREHKIMTEAEFLRLYEPLRTMLSFDPQQLHTIPLDHMASFLPRKYEPLQEDHGFMLETGPNGKLNVRLNQDYTDLLLELYPKLRDEYPVLADEEKPDEAVSLFWARTILAAFDERSKDGDREKQRSRMFLLGSTTIDDTNRQAAKLVEQLRAQVGSSDLSRFASLFGINAIHQRLVAVAERYSGMRLAGTSPEACPVGHGIDEALFDSSGGSNLELISVNHVAPFALPSGFGMGEDPCTCYRSAANFVLMRSLQTYSLLLMDRVYGPRMPVGDWASADRTVGSSQPEVQVPPSPVRASEFEPVLKRTAAESEVACILDPREADKKTTSFRELARKYLEEKGGCNILDISRKVRALGENMGPPVTPFKPESLQDSEFIENYQWTFDTVRLIMQLLYDDYYEPLRADKQRYLERLTQLKRFLDDKAEHVLHPLPNWLGLYQFARRAISLCDGAITTLRNGE
ncbi:hypothetical protein GMRT_10083 [Giardia muris]|uniref:Uncharacterized protein n=1 Tax=Giardia muris TaxID=5742 RepID=A0A4Z1SWP6_GIAMU|nr:hypothetical protein GMRT_10083 [Giardia muris]|eukprot:TNJ27948.1 hypothetical protein GMRT_10083 [Giardia muris]